jgi:hypothetical protein
MIFRSKAIMYNESPQPRKLAQQSGRAECGAHSYWMVYELGQASIVIT